MTPPMPRSLPVLLAVAVLGAGLGVLAQDAPTPAPAAADARFLVEVVDRRGEPVSELQASDLQVLGDGEPRPVATLERARPERIAVLFDLHLLGGAQLVGAAGVLVERAPALAALAPVELAVAEDEARTVLPPTADPEVLAQALSGVGVRYAARDAVGEVRGAFLEGLAEAAAGGALPPDVAFEAAREALALEAELLRDQRERLISWAAGTAPEGLDRAGSAGGVPPGALLLVSGGFDDDPLAFYREALGAHGLEAAADRLERPVVLPSLDEVARVLAAHGWMAFPYLPGGLEEPAGAAPAPPPIRDTLPPAGAQPSNRDDNQRPALITPRLPGRRDREEREGPELPAPAGGQAAPRSLAEATGGELVTDPLQLSDLVSRLGRRWSVRFPAPAGEPRPVEVRLATPGRGRDGDVTVRAPRWAGTVVPASVAAVRVRRLLDRELADEGSLPVEAAFEAGPSGLGEGRLTVRLGGGPGGPEEGAAPGAGPLRATVGIAREGREPLVFHELLEPGAGAGAAEAPEDRLHELPVTLPEGAESRVAVLVEDLATGRWGAAFASYLESTPLDESDLAGPAAPSDLLPSPRAIRLLAPRDPFVIGRSEIEAVASDPRVRRVDFFLDGERRGVSGAPPFRASLNFGALPRPRRVEAVAYGAGGEVLGRDVLVVNEGGGSFRVRIVEPGPEATGTAEAPLVGPVDVEAELTLPPDARLERVDFYWNTSLVASRFAAPFRQRMVVPAAAPDGFVRVVARLADGATAEDVVFINSPGTAERLDVNLVEMYVVVTDEQGRPVSGLGPEDFRVYEEGEEKELATFSDSRSLPLTVGLVIDSSASMFVKLPAVGLAAGRFVRDSLEADDRAFVVGFGGEPELVQETTSDESRLIRSIAALRADGQTALWEAVVYSLVQIQGAPGKKALIVYTDGADEDEDFPYRTTLRFARQVGVPVYFILTNNEIVRTGGKGLGVRAFLGRVRELAGDVGGNIYVVRHGEDLSAVYGEIGRELRSQYLLTYYSEDLPEATYRRVRVEAVDPDLTVRTIAGYFK